MSVVKVGLGKSVCKFAELGRVDGIPTWVCTMIPGGCVACFMCGDFMPGVREVSKNGKEA